MQLLDHDICRELNGAVSPVLYTGQHYQSSLVIEPVITSHAIVAKYHSGTQPSFERFLNLQTKTVSANADVASC